jgi:hypothetical protein
MSTDSLGNGLRGRIRRDEAHHCSVLIVYYSHNFSSRSPFEVFLLFWHIEELDMILNFKISSCQSRFTKRRRDSIHIAEVSLHVLPNLRCVCK